MFNIDLQEYIKVNSVEIYKKNYKIWFSYKNEFYLTDDFLYINGFCKELPMLNFNHVLIGGLGLGIIPYYLENYKSCEIDVVENNKDIIDAIYQLNHLKNARIIEDNFLSYECEKKYDLIIPDLWWLISEDFEQEKTQIIENYTPHLTDNGKIYFPVIDEIITK